MIIRLYHSFAATYPGFQLTKGIDFPRFSEDIVFVRPSPATSSLWTPFLRVTVALHLQSINRIYRIGAISLAN